MNNNAKLEELANKLVFNLIDVSLGIDEENDAYKEIIKSNNPTAIRKNCPRSRNILIIGAGASHAANEDIPLASTVINELKQDFSEGNKIIEKLIADSLHKLSRVYKLDESDFETNLLALNNLFGKELLKKIQIYYNHRYYPNIFYEIVAHLFKHRFIDIIINFNFDELLDQAILEEMGSGDFHYIYSDGHCPSNIEELFVRDILRTPIYIKPHGTSSHTSTLRFTREDYFSLPTDIDILMNRLIEGTTTISHSLNIPVNLIIAGFAMQSFEFNEILKKSLADNTSVYFFDTDKSILDKVDVELLEKKFIPHVFHVTESQTLDKWGQKLWHKIVNKFHSHYSPKSISRHLLINKLFESEKRRLRKQEEERYYFEDRIFTEIFISMIINKGLVTLERLTHNRVGIYFNKLKYMNLNLNSTSQDKPLSEFCTKLGLKPYKNWKEAYWIEEKDANRFDKNDLIEYLIKNLTKCLSKKRKSVLLDSSQGNYEIIKKYSLDLYNSNLKSINSSYSSIHNNVFDHLDSDSIIDTNLVWSYRFRQIISDESRIKKWDILLIMSDNGRVILNNHNRKFLINKKIGLITASEEEELNYGDFNLVGGKRFKLPWWLHKKHMVIFLKEVKTNNKISSWEDKWIPYRAIYYSDKSGTNINPVYLRSINDIKYLVQIFGRSVNRAMSAEKDEKIPVYANMNFGEETLNWLAGCATT